MRFTAALTLLPAMLALPLIAADGPAVGVGSAAPVLELSATEGETRSLANAGGPTVLIFYRGLW